MDDFCRLCCSTTFVNNDIFDEEKALYLKMSLYLPIKVFKNDRLPKKICDKCSCKVNDFYQFCNEAIDVQNRLRSVLLVSGVEDEPVDLIDNKDNIRLATQKPSYCEQSVQTEPENNLRTLPAEATHNNNSLPLNVSVKMEPKSQSLSPVKNEDDSNLITYEFTNFDSDSSEDMLLSDLKKTKKRNKKPHLTNGKSNSNKKIRKWKQKSEWAVLLSALPEGTTFKMTNDLNVKKEEDVPPTETLEGLKKKVKSEPGDEEYNCCICFAQCYSRAEMLQHYRKHGKEMDSSDPPPPAPPPPDSEPLKCMRCQKVLERGAWGAHWQRHWERDRRPYRCALCEKAFRSHHQILKHGASHKAGEAGEPGAAGAASAASAADKRFACDVCSESFAAMRWLLAHRARAHPEAAGRAPVPRCARCGRAFGHLNSLRRHLRSHSGERNYLCNVCGKALTSREHLKLHIRIHTGYKPNVCNTCGKGFVKKCNLTLHERVHSGEKPYVCPHCGKAFSQRSTLVIHERYHSGARPYVCALCGRGFVAKGLLTMHLKTTCV